MTKNIDLIKNFKTTHQFIRKNKISMYLNNFISGNTSFDIIQDCVPKEATIFSLAFPISCPAITILCTYQKLSDAIFTCILLSRLFVVTCAVQTPRNLSQ